LRGGPKPSNIRKITTAFTVTALAATGKSAQLFPTNITWPSAHDWWESRTVPGTSTARNRPAATTGQAPGNHCPRSSESDQTCAGLPLRALDPPAGPTGQPGLGRLVWMRRRTRGTTC
jgi:hypothetical protein